MGHLQKPACPTPAEASNPAPPTLLGAVPWSMHPRLYLRAFAYAFSHLESLVPCLFSRASCLTYPARAQTQPKALVPSPCCRGHFCRTRRGCKGPSLREMQKHSLTGGNPSVELGVRRRTVGCGKGRGRGRGEAVRSLGLRPGNLAV